MKNKIVVTGGSGRFGEIFKKIFKKNYQFPNKKDLNIMSPKKISFLFWICLKGKDKTFVGLLIFLKPLFKSQT